MRESFDKGSKDESLGAALRQAAHYLLRAAGD